MARGPPTLPCFSCARLFCAKSERDRHERIHRAPADQPFPCTFKGCSSTFTQRANRDSHVRTRHTMDKVVPCMLAVEASCELMFEASHKAHNHMQAYHSAFLYHCAACGSDARGWRTVERFASHARKSHPNHTTGDLLLLPLAGESSANPSAKAHSSVGRARRYKTASGNYGSQPTKAESQSQYDFTSPSPSPSPSLRSVDHSAWDGAVLRRGISPSAPAFGGPPPDLANVFADPRTGLPSREASAEEKVRVWKHSFDGNRFGAEEMEFEEEGRSSPSHSPSQPSRASLSPHLSVAGRSSAATRELGSPPLNASSPFSLSSLNTSLPRYHIQPPTPISPKRSLPPMPLYRFRSSSHSSDYSGLSSLESSEESSIHAFNTPPPDFKRDIATYSLSHSIRSHYGVEPDDYSSERRGTITALPPLKTEPDLNDHMPRW